MGARDRLNVASFNGSLVIAAIAGLAFDSWLVFSLVACVLIAGDLFSGAIRLSGGRSGRSHR